MFPIRKPSGSCCSAVGCSRRRNMNLLSQIKMYSFPRDPVRRAAWTNALKRENWTANNHSLICSTHFVTGKPSSDTQHPDYVPSVFSFSSVKSMNHGEKNLERYERKIKRQRHDSIPKVLPINDGSEETSLSSDDRSSRDASVQTEISLQNMDYYEKKIASLEEDNLNLRRGACTTKTYDKIINSNEKIFKFYTGLETQGLFSSLVIFLTSVYQPKVKVALKPCEQLLLVLMKLRLGLLNQDLACRFEIGLGTVSKLFHSWLDVMFINLKKVIAWPSRKEISKSLPQCFLDAGLQNVRCTIDCSEIFLEKPHNFKARAQTYSNYKHHNTLKFLVGITPCGVITFISSVWGGRVSDRQLTLNSGLLDLLEENDVLLADRGFRIEDLLSEKKCILIVPASTRNKNQLSAEDVYLSRNMARVRVHVERAIRKIKTYRILESNVPISLVKKNDGVFSTIDKIVLIVCALCNLSKPIIKK